MHPFAAEKALEDMASIIDGSYLLDKDFEDVHPFRQGPLSNWAYISTPVAPLPDWSKPDYKGRDQPVLGSGLQGSPIFWASFYNNNLSDISTYYDVVSWKVPTSEHAMMITKACLFGDEDAAVDIINAETPQEAKAIGRRVYGFSDDVWNYFRVELVYRIIAAKWRANADVLDPILDQTGNKIIAEMNRYDQIWATGLPHWDADNQIPERWQGHNLLGLIWTSVRENRGPRPEQVLLLNEENDD